MSWLRTPPPSEPDAGARSQFGRRRSINSYALVALDVAISALDIWSADRREPPPEDAQALRATMPARSATENVLSNEASESDVGRRIRNIHRN
jgi:hypothetical protein